MTSEEWQAEQKRVWGEVGAHDVFRDTVERLKLADNRLIRLADGAPPDGAEALVESIVEAMAAGSFGTGPALMRFQSLRPAIIAQVRRVLEERRGGNIAVWIVANAFLRGDTDEVEQKLPDGLRALSCEEYAAEMALEQ